MNIIEKVQVMIDTAVEVGVDVDEDVTAKVVAVDQVVVEVIRVEVDLVHVVAVVDRETVKRINQNDTVVQVKMTDVNVTKVMDVIHMVIQLINELQLHHQLRF